MPPSRNPAALMCGGCSSKRTAISNLPASHVCPLQLALILSFRLPRSRHLRGSDKKKPKKAPIYLRKRAAIMSGVVQ